MSYPSNTTSTTSLRHAEKLKASSKDYPSALASLQSTYGFSGAPVVPNITGSKNAQNLGRASAPDNARNNVQHDEKNFPAALANLQTAYGFSPTGAPVVPSSSGR
ncbi:hypothetical protein DL93DRAFT_2092448 [Clavulina sp. PMI_390]|nr:hypothetical protein DL93DRAFT_2092448 [Clavulina sp. PMI_390]